MVSAGGAGDVCRTCTELGWVPDASQRVCFQEEQPCDLAALAPVWLYISMGAMGGAIAGIGLTLAVLGSTRCCKRGGIVDQDEAAKTSREGSSPKARLQPQDAASAGPRSPLSRQQDATSPASREGSRPIRVRSRPMSPTVSDGGGAVPKYSL